ncbi:hypothetical protein ASE69_18600 [Sphingomonas sp. Leaf208]|nr:hypothetical protein ASE69_18600 [Sphingomonas sp. Leaf208]
MDFERLCLRLSRLSGSPEHWQLYGATGQAQGGIDIYVRRGDRDGYDVWQCKRHAQFPATLIRKAVKTFLEGGWVDRTRRFVLCTASPLETTGQAEEIEKQARILRSHKIEFVTIDQHRLSETLKGHADLVDDFFGRPWTERFCGTEAARVLSGRLDRTRMVDLRAGLRTLYERQFAAADPGVLRATSGLETPPVALPLTRRFVPPDLWAPKEADEVRRPDVRPPSEDEDDGPRRWRRRRIGPISRVRRTETRSTPQRISLTQWSLTTERSVILGEPGTGKSTLLRFVALDMLSREPRLQNLRNRWPGRLPILLPFAFWTRRLAGISAGRETSVPGAVKAWFEQLGAADIARHVEAAFKDGRVSLLVDGVDEWADEAAAESALTILHTFASASGIPTIVTSRPHGSRVLGALDATWVRHSLAHFDRSQQCSFAEAWFEWLGEAEGGHRTPGQAQDRAEAFVAEVARSPHIAILAGAPLLLGGLMATAREGGTLPGSRREAYTELVGRVLESHPRSRSRSALTPVAHGELDAATRRRALAALAFEMQRGSERAHAPDGAGVAEATVFLRDHLIETLDLAVERARQRASELVSVGAEAIGILVERAPGELGFLHRAFQELLAAEHLAAMDLEEQRRVFAERAHDAQWRDVLLFAAQMAQRPGDVDNLVLALEATEAPPGVGVSRDLLLAEMAFGPLRRTPGLTRRLTTRFLFEVEHGSGKAPRSEVMRHALLGLLSEQTAGIVGPRLKRWYPSLHTYRYGDAFAMMDAWHEPGVDAALLRALDADEDGTRSRAADVLAKRRGGDNDFAEKLFDVASRPPSVEAAAAAVRCLARGWPTEGRVQRLADAAAACPTWQIAAAGIAARIDWGRQTDGERDRLLDGLTDFGIDRTHASVGLLAAGWANDAKLRQFVMERLGKPGHLFSDVRRLAAAAFPGDHEVAMKLANELSSPAGRFGLHECWSLLEQAHAGNALLADALVAGQDRSDAPYVLAHAARIAATPRIRDALLKVLLKHDSIEFWAVGALLDHWSDDAEVRAALAGVLKWTPERLIRVAERIPELEEDAAFATARVRELALLALAAGGRQLAGPMNVLTSAKAIDDPLAEALIAAALNVDPTADDAPYLVIAAAQAAPKDPRVHALALDWLRRPAGLLGVLALLLGEVACVREAVIESCAPLPQPLRSELTEALAGIAGSSGEALETLREGEGDGDPAIAADATVLHAAAVHRRGEIDEVLLRRLEAQLQAKGTDLENLRLAALAGLMAAGRPGEAARGAAARDSLKVGLSGWSSETDGPLLDVLAAHWPEIEQLYATGTTWLELTDSDLVSRLAPWSEGRPRLSAAIREAAMRMAEAGTSTLHSLKILLRDPETADRAIDPLVAMLGSDGSWAGVEGALGAARALAGTFGGRRDVGALIEARLQAGLTDGPAAALCDGWPDSKVLGSWFETLRAGLADQDTLSIPVRLKVIATLSAADVLIANLEAVPDQVEEDDHDWTTQWADNARRRLAVDEVAYDMAWASLRRSNSPGARASLASLLVQARGLTADLRDWLVAEMDSDLGDGLAEIGMDVVAGHHVVTARRFADLLWNGGAPT